MNPTYRVLRGLLLSGRHDRLRGSDDGGAAVRRPSRAGSPGPVATRFARSAPAPMTRRASADGAWRALTVDRVERTARVMAVIVGMFVLSLTVIGPQSAWGLLGAVPVAMGWSGW